MKASINPGPGLHPVIVGKRLEPAYAHAYGGVMDDEDAQAAVLIPMSVFDAAARRHLAEELGELHAEIARLKAELAAQSDVSVLHATGAQCERIIESGAADTERVGTLLRSTDDGRTWEQTSAGWQPR